MKFKEQDVLYHACPISFFITKIQVEYAVKESCGLYYVGINNRYYLESNLFSTLDEAKARIMQHLDDFYLYIAKEIKECKPELIELEAD